MRLFSEVAPRLQEEDVTGLLKHKKTPRFGGYIVPILTNGNNVPFFRPGPHAVETVSNAFA